MRRSFVWTMLCVLVVIAAPLATQFAFPVGVARAEPDAPAAVHHDEVVTLSPNGQIIVTDVFPQTGMIAANWNSGADTGWQYIAAGDFRGDGYEQIVAIRGGQLKVFDPFAVQAGKTPVTFERTLDKSGSYELITTGDFNRDGKADIAATASSYDPNYASNLWVYNVSANTVLRYDGPFAVQWQAITAGDFNNDGASDLAMARNVQGSPSLLKVLNGFDWSVIAEETYGYPWITLEAGRLASTSLPDQLALLRTGVGASLDSLLMFHVNSGSFSDVFPAKNDYWHYLPNFTSLALAAMSGTKQDVIYILRDPGYDNGVGLVMVNPAEVPLPGHEIQLGTGTNAWHQVRAGDVNGDGRDEIVILRSDRFRVYPQLWKSKEDGGESFFDVTGSSRTQPTGTDWPVMVLANLDGPGISAGPTLAVTPASLSFDLQFGAISPSKPLSITNTGAGSSFPWQAAVTAGGGWLQIDSTQGTTPGQVNVTVKTNVAPGTYNGTIRISSTDSSVKNNPVDIPVTYTLTGSGLLVTPTSMSFTVPWGEPGPQKVLSIGGGSASGAIAWTAEVLGGASWLNLGALSGTTPSTLYVSVSSTVAGVGTHQGTIKIAAVEPSTPNSPQYVTVSLTVPDPGFVIYPTQTTIWQKIGAITVTREIQIVRPSAPTNWVATALPLSAAAGLEEKFASGAAKITEDGVVIDGVQVPPPSWLVFTPDFGTTRTVMTVGVAPGTPAGTYRGVIIVVAQDPTVTNPVQSVTVDAVVANEFKYNFLPLIMK